MGAFVFEGRARTEIWKRAKRVRSVAVALSGQATEGGAARSGAAAGKRRPRRDDELFHEKKGSGMKRKLNRGRWVKGCKERGEWVELCFMAKAAGMGMQVSKPLGESCRYDVLVEAGGRILRVQVKSTMYRRRGNEYSLNVMGPGRKRYKAGSVDFFAVYLIPEDAWYILPYAALGKKLTLHFVPGGRRQKYAKYREAWNLLRGKEERIEIFACVELAAGDAEPSLSEGAANGERLQ